MPKNTPAQHRYGDQRPKVTPPHVGLGDLRAAVGLTLDQVCDRVAEVLGEDERPTKGAISAIENGHRGASVKMLAALCTAYGMRDGAITTTYIPRVRDAALAATA